MAEGNSKGGCYVGVDLGATKIRVGVFHPNLRLLGAAKLTTKPQRGVEGVLERVTRCVRYAVDEADLSFQEVCALGIGAPGTVDADSGTVRFAPNLDWHDVPLKRQLEEQLKTPVFVENDCSAAMLGILAAELNPKPRHALGLFVGTGIGGGVIIDGELHRGYTNTAGEVGHMVLDLNGPKCACGRKGCLEALASRTAMFKRIRSAVKDGRKTVLHEWLGEDLDSMRCGDLKKAIKRGDKLVQSVVDEAAQFIGLAVSNLVNILNPQVVVLGGGVMESLADIMMGTIVKTARERAMPGALRGVDVVATSLGGHCTTTGGAALSRRMVRPA